MTLKTVHFYAATGESREKCNISTIACSTYIDLHLLHVALVVSLYKFNTYVHDLSIKLWVSLTVRHLYNYYGSLLKALYREMLAIYICTVQQIEIT